jgi:hypothetical protein
MEEVSRKRKVVVFAVVALMFSTAITYFVAASKESSELQESQPISALETRKGAYVNHKTRRARRTGTVISRK